MVNVTCMDNVTGAFTAAQCTNSMGDGLYSILTLVALTVVLFTIAKARGEDTKVSVLVISFLISLLTILFISLDFLELWILAFPTTIFFGSLFAKLFWGD